MSFPKFSPKWNKEIDGIEAGRWALDCMRSLLPDEMIVPRAGQIWQTRRDCEVGFRASISTKVCLSGNPAGLTHLFDLTSVPLRFGSAKLRLGEKVRILLVDDAPKPLLVEFVPLRYAELEAQIVPEEIRRLTGYQGYNLMVQTAKTPDFLERPGRTYFNEDFTLDAS